MSREIMQQALIVLKQYDALIKHQYGGSKEAMTDLQLATWVGYDAIAALEQELNKPINEFNPDWDTLQPYHERIAELEAQLALDKKADNARELGLDYEPEQVPVWCGCGDGIVADDGAKCGVCVMQLENQIERLKSQPEQEPVAWITRRTGDGGVVLSGYETCDPTDYDATPVYTAPPKRKWQSLTDEEILSFVAFEPHPLMNRTSIIYAVQAKLREKNE